jgi:hypothetical protein
MHYTKIVMLRLKKRLLWVVLATVFAGSILGALTAPMGVHAADATPTPSPAAEDKKEAQCDAASMTWLVCPVIDATAKGVQYLESKIENELSFKPLSQDPKDPIKAVWSSFRNLANIFFILIFFVIIFGTSLGLNNYTVKKILPRLIAATILVQFSYLIMGLLVDIFNVLGYGIGSLVDAALPAGTGHKNNGIGIMAGVGIAEIVAGFAATGAIVIGLGMIGPVLLTVLSALLGLIAVFLTLEFRLLLMNCFIMFSPFVFVLWVLPNTERYAKTFWSWFIRTGLVFAIVEILFGGAKVVNIALTSGGNANNDAWTQIMASLAPILAFFMVPSAFSYAGKALNMGTSAFSNLAGRGQGKIGGFKKNLDEGRREKGLLKYDRMRGQQAAPTRLGRMSQAVNRRAAMMQGGFGSARGNNAKARKLEGAADSAVGSIAEHRGVQQARTEMGMRSQTDRMDTKQASAFSAEMGKRADEAGMQAFTWTNGDGDQVTGRLNQAVGAADDLKQHATRALQSGDYATGIAAMQVMAKNASGRQALHEMRTDQALFGGTDRSKVNAGNFEGRAQEIYDIGAAGIKPEAAPDLTKTQRSAFTGVSGAEFAAMDPATKARFIQYGAQQGGDVAAGVNSAMQAALSSQQLSSRLGPDDFAAMKRNTGGDLAEAHGRVTQADIDAHPPDSDAHARLSAARSSETNLNTVISAEVRTKIEAGYQRGIGQTYAGAPAATPAAPAAPVTPAHPAPAPAPTPAAIPTTPSPQPVTVQVNMPAGVPNNYRPNGPGGLYVPPGRTPYVDPLAEEDPENHVGPDRSVR